MPPTYRWLRGSIAVAIFLLVGGLLFLFAMGRGLNHDEHQFIAPGVLLSREGLLPYRDYPLFHLPNLVFIYAALDWLTHQPILSFKTCNVAASTGMLVLLFLAGTSRRGPLPLQPRHFWLTLGVLLLVFSDQLFVFTAGKTWNHEVPAFFLVAAILCHVRGMEHGRHRWFATSGFLVGLATGTRLTYAPVALAFVGLLSLAPLPRRDRLMALAYWCGACLVALTPTFYFLITERERFIFDNFRFPRLRLEDVTDTRAQKTMVWWRKLRYLFKEIIAHSLPLTLALIGAAAWPIRRRIKEHCPISQGLLACTVVLPFATLGACLPSRYQYQHFFVLIPLFGLATCFAVRSWTTSSRWWSITFAAITLVALTPLNVSWEPRRNLTSTSPAKINRAGGYLAYRIAPTMLNPRNWFVTKLRRDYSFAEGIGPILTLAPAGVLEVGGQIIPEFATGPFAWRGAKFIPANRLKALGFIGPLNLHEQLSKIPTCWFVTGVEDEELEKDIIAEAQSRGNILMLMSGTKVWVENN